MKPSKLYEALHALIGERVPLHIWGVCGVGKSQIVAQVAQIRQRRTRADVVQQIGNESQFGRPAAVNRLPRDAGALRDRIDRQFRIAAFAEQLGRGRKERFLDEGIARPARLSGRRDGSDPLRQMQYNRAFNFRRPAPVA